MKVPEGWTYSRTSDYGQIQAGRQLSPSKLQGEQFPYLRVANVLDGVLALSDVKSMAFTEAEREIYVLRHGDILLNEGQSDNLVGRCAVYKEEIEPCFFQNTLIRFRYNGRACNKFAFYSFQRCLYDGIFKSISKRTTSIAHLGVSRFSELKLLWPPLPEQKAIADTLSTWDTTIDTMERLIAAKERLLASVREHAFQKTADSVLVRLGDVTKESDARNNGWLDRDRVMAVTKSVGMRPMREETIASSLTRYKVVPPCGFAYNPMRLNIGSIAMSAFESDVLVSPDYVVFVCESRKMLPRLLEHLRRTERWTNHFENAGNGGVRVRIHYEELARFEFWCPPSQRQPALLAKLDLVASEIDLLRKQLDLLKRQKRGLMQKLLTGTWRVPVPQETP